MAVQPLDHRHTVVGVGSRGRLFVRRDGGGRRLAHGTRIYRQFESDRAAIIGDFARGLRFQTGIGEWKSACHFVSMRNATVSDEPRRVSDRGFCSIPTGRHDGVCCTLGRVYRTVFFFGRSGDGASYLYDLVRPDWKYGSPTDARYSLRICNADSSVFFDVHAAIAILDRG